MRAPSSYNTVRTCNCLRFRRRPQLFSTPHCRERLEDGMFLAIPQAAKCQEAWRPQGGGRVGPQPPGGSQLTPAFPRVKPVIRVKAESNTVAWGGGGWGGWWSGYHLLVGLLVHQDSVLSFCVRIPNRSDSFFRNLRTGRWVGCISFEHHDKSLSR